MNRSYVFTQKSTFTLIDNISQWQMLWGTHTAFCCVVFLSGQKRMNQSVWDSPCDSFALFCTLRHGRRRACLQTGEYVCLCIIQLTSEGTDVAGLTFSYFQMIKAHLLAVLLIIIEFSFTVPRWTVPSMTYNCFSGPTQWVWYCSWIISCQQRFKRPEIRQNGCISRLLCNHVQYLRLLQYMRGISNRCQRVWPLLHLI